MSDELLGDLLRRVSRSFYLSLAILPRPLREPIGLAYLLARAADTVADTRLVPRPDRLAHLETLRRAYAGQHADVHAALGAAMPHQAHQAERALLGRVGDALARVAGLSDADRDAVRDVLATLTSGMILDLERFPGEDVSALAALETLDDLDHYTYLVAGCVGPFWTRVHIAHRPRLAGWGRDIMSARAVRFGKALQLTNVLRDAPRDLRAGRCYIPSRELARLGVAPGDLLDPATGPRVRPLLMRLLTLTREHYQVAWQYTLAIPPAEWRMRLACAWPLMIGLATVQALEAHGAPLMADPPVKIARRHVRAIVGRSLVTVWSNRALGRQVARLATAPATSPAARHDARRGTGR